MQIEVRVNMKAEYIYDLLLFHTYSQFSGFLVNVLGLAVIIAGGFLLGTEKIDVFQALLYVFAGIGFLSFTPLTLKQKAKNMMKAKRYQNDMIYSFSEEGIMENLENKITVYSWSQVKKAISTPKDIAFYVGNSEALLLPKTSFGSDFMPVMKLITENVTRDRIYIR